MRIVPALHGWYWLRDGARLFAVAPVTWMLLVFSYWLVMGLIGTVPIIGALAGIVLIPAFNASFLHIARAAERGGVVTPMLLFSGLRSAMPAMLILGGVYIVGCTLVLGATSLVDDGELVQFLMTSRMPTTRDMNGPIVGAAGYMPIMLAFWFAPALVIWHNMSATKSLFYSFFAAGRNWRAMMVYGVLVAAIVIGAAWLMAMFVLTFAPDMVRGASPAPGAARGPGAFLMFVILPMIFAGFGVLFGSFYASYRDVFADAILPR